MIRQSFEHTGHKGDKDPKIKRLSTHLLLCHKGVRMGDESWYRRLV